MTKQTTKKNVIIEQDAIDGVNIIDAETGQVIINLLNHETAVAWLNNPYWKRLYSLKQGVARFAWTYEVVAENQVIQLMDWDQEGPAGYESLHEYAQDLGVPSARKFAKRYARENKLAFIEDKSGHDGYSQAVLAAYHGRAC